MELVINTARYTDKCPIPSLVIINSGDNYNLNPSQISILCLIGTSITLRYIGVLTGNSATYNWQSDVQLVDCKTVFTVQVQLTIYAL